MSIKIVEASPKIFKRIIYKTLDIGEYSPGSYIFTQYMGDEDFDWIKIGYCSRVKNGLFSKKRYGDKIAIKITKDEESGNITIATVEKLKLDAIKLANAIQVEFSEIDIGVIIKDGNLKDCDLDYYYHYYGY